MVNRLGMRPDVIFVGKHDGKGDHDWYALMGAIHPSASNPCPGSETREEVRTEPAPIAYRCEPRFQARLGVDPSICEASEYFGREAVEVTHSPTVALVVLMACVTR